MTIRNSWLQGINNSIQHWFVVGSQSCPIPPGFLKDQFSCQEIEYNTTGLQLDSRFYTHQVTNRSSSAKFRSIHAFGFKVHQEIVIHKLGLVESAFLNSNVTFTVILLNDFKKEVIAKTQLGGVVTSGTSHEGYRYRRVGGTFVLPKGFEGVLLVEPQPPGVMSVATNWFTAGGMVTFTKLMSGDTGWQSGDQLHNVGSFVSLEFSLQDVPALQTHLAGRQESFNQWDKITREVKLNLEKEMAEHQDVLMVEGLDVYRRLPQKLLGSISWLKDLQYQFLLKTDDDVSLNLRSIQEELSSLNPEENIIWGRFRRWWQVNDCGKWADVDYVSLTYPPFPCGGGYVLSKPLVSWLADNSPYLHPYQGEDASMGIWLAALHPRIVEDERWSCDDSCTPSSFNWAQLSPSKMEESWKNYQDCRNICQCGQDTKKVPSLKIPS